MLQIRVYSFVFIFYLVFSSNSAKSLELTGEPKAQLQIEKKDEQTRDKQKNDKWFLYLGAGVVPQPKFDSGIQSRIDGAKQSNSWAGEYAGTLELPGLYYRVGESTMLGLIAVFIFENYARDFKQRQSLGYDTYSISMSALTSTGAQPGLGYFARFDIGPCELVQISESSNSYSRNYFSGFFEQLAIGYGFQSSRNTRLLVHLNTFYEEVVDHYQTGISFNIGFLL